MTSWEDAERSEGGSRILRHDGSAGDSAPATHGPLTAEVETYLAEELGTPATVFHEIASDQVHIDVHFVPASAQADSWTLFTTGVSDLPMTTPDGFDDFRFAELVLRLPSSWDMAALQAGDERWFWPVRELKFLGRLAHEYQTWLGFGHTIPNGDPAEPFAPGTGLCGWLILNDNSPPMSRSDGQVVNFYTIFALHRDEMDFKLRHGVEALLELLVNAGVSDVLDPGRTSVVPRKRFGLFG